MAAKGQSNVKSGYVLAAEALDYLAEKLSSTKNGDQLKVKNELMKLEVDANVEDLRQSARRLREYYERSEIPEPRPGSKDREAYIISKANEIDDVNSMKKLICSALGIYGDDLIQTRMDIPGLVLSSKPNEQYSESFLKMENVQRQLEIINIAMQEDYCGK